MGDDRAAVGLAGADQHPATGDGGVARDAPLTEGEQRPAAANWLGRASGAPDQVGRRGEEGRNRRRRDGG